MHFARTKTQELAQTKTYWNSTVLLVDPKAHCLVSSGALGALFSTSASFIYFVCCSVACYFDCSVVYKSKLWVAEWQTGSSTDVCPLYALGLLTIGEYQWNWFTVSTLLRPVNWPLEARWKWTENHSCAVHPYCMLAFQASAMEIWSDVSGSAATTNRLNTMQPLTVKPLQIDTL